MWRAVLTRDVRLRVATRMCGSSSSTTHRLLCGSSWCRVLQQQRRDVHTLPRLRPRTLSHVRQQPIYPGAAPRATQFAGQHVYNYARHTFAIAYESMSLAVVPLGCVAALLYWLYAPPTLSLATLLHLPLSSPWGVCACYAVVVATLSRLVARGRVNRVRRSLAGKHIVVTGATSGVGLCTAAQLARLGARLTLLVRDAGGVDGDGQAVNGNSSNAQTARAVAYITAQAKRAAAAAATTPVCEPSAAMVRVEALDLADFVAVREYCARARRRGEAIDVLVNCAAVLHEGDVKTRFGDDAQLAVNYLGPFLLTEGLLPLVAAARGRVVYVTCTAHTAVHYHAHATTRRSRGHRGSGKASRNKASGDEEVIGSAADKGGDLTSTYLSGRGVWSPRVAGQFDALEQYGFTKLGNIYHAQELAQRALRAANKRTRGVATAAATATTATATTTALASKTTTATTIEATTVSLPTLTMPATSSRAARAAAAGDGAGDEGSAHAYTTCACAPGAVLTGLYRHVTAGPFAMRYLYWLLLLFMRTPWEGSQGVVNCCLRDDVRSGGYYMHMRYRPTGLSRAACSVRERERVMAWTRRRMQPFMTWD